MSYIGNEPIVSATRTVTEVSATAGQTVFTANSGYTVGFIDVFVNGSKLTNSDFTATNGTTITLNEAAQASDIVRLEALGTFLTSSALTANNPNYTGTLTGGTGVVNIGSGQVYKSAGGEVGINTSSPTSSVPLTILANSGNAVAQVIRGRSDGIGALLFTDNAGTENGRIDFRTDYAAINLVRNAPLVFNTNATERMRLTSDGLLQFNSGYGSVATAYGCRAWVRFNGTGTVAINGSGNVSSITDGGVGTFTINFTTALPDANYSAVGNAVNSTNFLVGMTSGNNPTTTSLPVRVTDPAGNLTDPTFCFYTIFR